jgi:hypothetical protein
VARWRRWSAEEKLRIGEAGVDFPGEAGQLLLARIIQQDLNLGILCFVQTTSPCERRRVNAVRARGSSDLRIAHCESWKRADIYPIGGASISTA